jgi:hypothetical protein
VAGGCRTKPYVNAHIETVNAEYRQLEDYTYSLEEENARLQQELDAARALAATGRLPGASSPPPSGGLFRRSPPDAGRPRTPAADAPPSLEGPVIELPGESTPPRSPSGPSRLQRPELGAEPISAPADTPPNIEPRRPTTTTPDSIQELLPTPDDPPGVPSPKAPSSLPFKPIDRKITHLHLNGPLTGGANFDSQPGDDGLRIVLEPRNAADEFVSEAGSLSVVVLDPQREGDGARLARWDFDESETRQLLADSSGRGLNLELPWPAAPPEAERLKLFVRYETADGRRLQTDREIYLNTASMAKGSWTPRSATRDESVRVAGSKSEIRSTKSETSTNH